MKIWKLLLALAIDAALFIIAALVLFKAAPAGTKLPKLQIWVVVAVAWVGLALKIFLADVVADKFEYHKHGYDFCTLTMGTILTTFALQALGGQDLLPLLPAYNLASDPAVALQQTLLQRSIFLGVLFILSVLLSMLAARISRAVMDPTTRAPGILAFINFSLGVLAFVGYFVLLIAKVAK